MTEPLTTGLLITLAVQEFVKSGTGDLAKRFTAEALEKIPVLWEKIKTRLMERLIVEWVHILQTFIIWDLSKR